MSDGQTIADPVARVREAADRMLAASYLDSWSGEAAAMTAVGFALTAMVECRDGGDPSRSLRVATRWAEEAHRRAERGPDDQVSHALALLAAAAVALAEPPLEKSVRTPPSPPVEPPRRRFWNRW